LGIYYVGSSIGLMVMLLALGVMSVAWMGVVAAVVLIQNDETTEQERYGSDFHHDFRVSFTAGQQQPDRQRWIRRHDDYDSQTRFPTCSTKS
jgi:hypothetical protein